MTDAFIAPHEFSITLVHHAALGDTVLLIPLLKSLRMRWEGCRITLVTRPAFGELLAHLGFIDAWYSADSAEHSAWFGAFESDEKANLPAWARCDLLVSAVSNGCDDWAKHARAAMAGCAESLYFFEPRPPADFVGHVTQWHREQLKQLELVASELPAPAGCVDGPVLIHPGSGGAKKCWPVERFIEVGKQLSARKMKVDFILGEAELERWPREKILAIRNGFVCHEMPSLIQLAEMMRRARAWIGNDSGPTHLAAAMGLGGVAIFGPSDDVQWRPVGPIEVVRARECGGSDLRELSVDDVMLRWIRAQ